MRYDGRSDTQLRPVKITTDFIEYPEGSVLIEWGRTKVICNATVEEKVPPFLRDTGKGWITAEYSMLPRATMTRTSRDIGKLKLSGRSAEIQRLIGRALRSVADLEALGERCITIDCDVIQADGGTRCASITGGFCALVIALNKLKEQGIIDRIPLRSYVSAVSVGIVDDRPLCDLCYVEDSGGEVDFNFVMNERGDIIELQGTGEERPFSKKELDKMYDMAFNAAKELAHIQSEAVGHLMKPQFEDRTFVLASNNKKKLKEMRDILAREGCHVISMAEAGIESNPEETGTTFEENSYIKAKAAAEASGMPCIADDSGIAVDALGGAPGVYSSRYCEGSDDDRTNFLLKNMEGKENRKARYVSVVTCVFPDGSHIAVRGECEGEITDRFIGEGGFGYDPIFYSPSEGCTFAELPAERKNKISHRAIAMDKFCEALKSKWNEEK